MNMEFWKGKKVLVTGSTGFKGQWLMEVLKHLGADASGFGIEQIDLGDFHQMSKVLQMLDGVEIVFHMAAQALVADGYAYPCDTFNTNVMGTVHLLETIRASGDKVKVIVTITSDKCYVNEDFPYYGKREGDPLGGDDPYSASKACQDIVAQCYAESFFAEKGISCVTARAGNVIGGGDVAENRLIPDCVRAVDRKEPVVLRSPTSTRPFQHVLDALNGYMILAEKAYSEPLFDSYNFGPMESWTVEKAAKHFMFFMNGEVAYGKEKFSEKHSLILDSSKAKYELGWKPLLTTGAAICWAAREYRGDLAYERRMSIYNFVSGNAN